MPSRSCVRHPKSLYAISLQVHFAKLYYPYSNSYSRFLLRTCFRISNLAASVPGQEPGVTLAAFLSREKMPTVTKNGYLNLYLNPNPVAYAAVALARYPYVYELQLLNIYVEDIQYNDIVPYRYRMRIH